MGPSKVKAKHTFVRRKKKAIKERDYGIQMQQNTDSAERRTTIDHLSSQQRDKDIVMERKIKR